MLLKEIHDQLENSDLLYSSSEIINALKVQANSINSYLQSLVKTDKPAVILPVMNGGLIYAGQLLPLISEPVEVDYIHATRYRNTTKGSDLDWKVYPQTILKDRVVIVLDDIFDEGYTLEAIVNYCQKQAAREVLTSVLVTKNHDRRDVEIKTDFSALDVPDRYVFGYGMDYQGQLRNINGIYALR